MDHKAQEKALEADLGALLDRYAAEFGLTVFQALGA